MLKFNDSERQKHCIFQIIVNEISNSILYDTFKEHGKTILDLTVNMLKNYTNK